MRLSCRVRGGDHCAAGVASRRAGGGTCHRYVRGVFVCNGRETGSNRGGGVQFAAAIRLWRISQSAGVVFALFSLAGGLFRLFGQTNKTRQRLVLGCSHCLLLYGMFYADGQRSNAVLVGLHRAGRKTVFFGVAAFYDTANCFYGNFRRRSLFAVV